MNNDNRTRPQSTFCQREKRAENSKDWKYYFYDFLFHHLSSRPWSDRLDRAHSGEINVIIISV